MSWKIKAHCYQTLVRPIMEYVRPICSLCRLGTTTLSCNVRKSWQQNHFQQYKPDTELCWKSLVKRLTNAKLAILFRIKWWSTIPANIFLHPSFISTRSHIDRYNVLFCRTDRYRHSFLPSAIPLWNQLPASLTTADCCWGLQKELVRVDPWMLLFLTLHCTYCRSPHYTCTYTKYDNAP